MLPLRRAADRPNHVGSVAQTCQACCSKSCGSARPVRWFLAHMAWYALGRFRTSCTSPGTVDLETLLPDLSESSSYPKSCKQLFHQDFCHRRRSVIPDRKCFGPSAKKTGRRDDVLVPTRRLAMTSRDVHRDHLKWLSSIEWVKTRLLWRTAAMVLSTQDTF